jgi:hypothetical protein
VKSSTKSPKNCNSYTELQKTVHSNPTSAFPGKKPANSSPKPKKITKTYTVHLKPLKKPNNNNTSLQEKDLFYAQGVNPNK